MRSTRFVGKICGTKWRNENGSDASPSKKVKGTMCKLLLRKQWGICCLSMAMLTCLSLRAEATMKKHSSSRIAYVTNRLALTRYISIIHVQKYKHKSEAEIAHMTPAQRVN